jgi:hypothetical protein
MSTESALTQSAETQSTSTEATQATEVTQPSSSAGDFFSASPKDWSANLPDDLKDYKGFERYPTTADFLRGHRELQKAWDGRQQVKPPGEGAKPEEVAAWRKLMGAPEKPEDYGLKAPEKLPEGIQWNEDLAKDFAALAHKHHLPPAVVQELAEFHNQNLAKMQQSAGEQMALATETARAEMQKAWGQDLPKNAAMVTEFAKMIELDVSDPKYGNDPVLAQALLRSAELLNRLTAEPSGLITGSTAPIAQTAQAAYDKIINSDDFMGKNGPDKAQAAVAQLRALHGRIKPAEK